MPNKFSILLIGVILIACAAGFEGFIEFPIATDDLAEFTFVLVADNAKNWGAYQDAYEGSPAAKIDETWGEVTDCSISTLWNSVKIE
jgi:hypothetical protein